MTRDAKKIQDEFQKKIQKLINTPQTLEMRPETRDEAVTRADFNYELLEMASESVESAFFYVDFAENGDIRKIQFSQNFRKMLSKERDEEMRGAFEEFIGLLHPEDRDIFFTDFFTAIAGKKDFTNKIRIKTVNEKYEWFECTGRCRTYQGGEPRLFMGTFTNITTEEIENKDLMGRLEAMIGGVKGGIMVTRLDMGFPYEYISEAVAALQGYTPEELKEKTSGLVTNNVHPDDATRINDEVVERLDHHKDTLHLKYRVQHKDGHSVWVNDYGKITHMPDGSVKVYSLVQDMTSQVMASTRLAQEQAQYREALARNAICTFSFDLTDEVLNEDIVLENGESILGRLGVTLPVNMRALAKAYVENEHITVSRKDNSWLFSVEGLKKLFEQGKTGEMGEFYDPVIDRYVRVQALLFNDIFTGHLMCRYICTDISREKRGEENQRKALLEAMKQANEANRAKTVFLSNMSHDIRTPMNAIMGYTTLAQSHVDDRDKTLEYLEKIQGSGKHLLQLINDVLDMSRIESGTIVLEENKVDLAEDLTELLNIVAPGARDKKIEVKYDVKVENREVYVDRLRLNQVVINCLGNAVKFTPKGGKITLTLSQKSSRKAGFGHFEIHVKDTGIGIAEDYLNHIFEPFTRENNSTVSGIQGTGLGMAISKNIVDIMGGDIEVKSKKGQGTEFIISLTLRLAEDSEKNGAADEKVYTDAPGVKVLLVEDNAINREIATEILKEGGVVVTTANDGADAVEMVKNLAPGDIDIILMDVQMPGMNGLEATKLIRKLPDEYRKNIPIVAMTANAFEEDKRAALSAGMNAHLTKPIVVAELWKTINELK